MTVFFRLASLLLLLLTTACQPLPHPFADMKDAANAPALSPPDSAGIVVLPVAGAPEPASLALAAAMATALQQADVPASTEAHNRGSYRLAGTAQEQALDNGRSTVMIDWVLSDAAGRIVGHRSDTLDAAAAQWRQGDADLAAQLARQAAPVIAGLVEGDAPLPAAASTPDLTVQGVTGAPGDGGTALTQAIGTALTRANFAIANPAEKSSFILTGRVEMSPPAQGEQQVTVSWILSRPDGIALGQVSQQNAVPAGSLDHAWGDVAYAVASAAAPGITALIERARRDTAGS